MVDLQKVLADLFEQSLPDIAYQWSQVATYRVTERLNKSVITITFRFPIALQSALYERTLSRLLMDQGYSQDQFSINMAHDVPIHLVDKELILETAKILGYGAEKYEAHNWRIGIPISRYFSAAQRHLLAWNDGEDNDPESGLPHHRRGDQ